jgi:hypothetical protein
MKYNTITLACLTALAPLAPAAIIFSAPYSGTVYHTHSNADAVVSFDRGSDGNTYYATSAGFASGGLYRKEGAASTQLVAGSGSLFSGSSVTSIGSLIYYNDSNLSNQFIRTYDIGTSATTSTTLANYALGTDGANLFTSDGAFGMPTNLRYYASGSLGTSVKFGEIAGASGPITFDSAGNLFYASGSNKSIYRWTAAELASAIAGGPQLSATGSLFANYSLAFPSAIAAPSMAIDAAGSLFVTLTDFGMENNLVRFDASGATHELVATSGDGLGGVDIQDGQLYVASGNQIFSVIPEPSALLLSLLTVIPLTFRRRR